MGKIESTLQELKLTLPLAARPLAAYVPFVITGQLIFVSGQLPMRNGQLDYIGKLGQNFSIEEGVYAAELCALNVLAQAKEALGGNLDRIQRIVKLTGFVNCTSEFYMIPTVVNGASELFIKVFGENGRHARSAVGAALPLNAAVEVDAVIEFK